MNPLKFAYLEFDSVQPIADDESLLYFDVYWNWPVVLTHGNTIALLFLENNMSSRRAPLKINSTALK